MYGLNAKIHAHLLQHDFGNFPTESTLCPNDGEKLLTVVLYVDELIITEPNEQEIADCKADLSKVFELTDLGHLNYYLTIQFITVDGGHFSQSMKVH